MHLQVACYRGVPGRAHMHACICKLSRRAARARLDVLGAVAVALRHGDVQRVAVQPLHDAVHAVAPPRVQLDAQQADGAAGPEQLCKEALTGDQEGERSRTGWSCCWWEGSTRSEGVCRLDGHLRWAGARDEAKRAHEGVSDRPALGTGHAAEQHLLAGEEVHVLLRHGAADEPLAHLGHVFHIGCLHGEPLHLDLMRVEHCSRLHDHLVAGNPTGR